MGETNPRFTEGWKAFERGEALHLGLDTDTVFADGWLEAAQCALVPALGQSEDKSNG